ncbi:LmbU family transcriptional regulator [Streptomyces sp. NPDC059649]|uniref:LmbU family transcriptional regulator n=1 Tax=Streptomyces sp. NPDC059649 TaxID=3346895 RepID=UPI00367F892F
MRGHTYEAAERRGSKMPDSTAPILSIGRREGETSPRQLRDTAEQRQRRQVLTTKVGLQLPTGLTYENWERAGRQLSGIVNSSSWWLGDWLVYGKDHYEDRYERAAHALGLRYQTLRNYAWVSRRFSMHRRRGELSFQHHAEVASLPVEEQEHWLDKAEQNEWSTKQLRNSMRLAQGTGDEVQQQGERTQQLAVPTTRLQRWHVAAARSGVDLEKWVLITLDSAAEQALENAPGAEAEEPSQVCI